MLSSIRARLYAGFGFLSGVCNRPGMFAVWQFTFVNSAVAQDESAVG